MSWKEMGQQSHIVVNKFEVSLLHELNSYVVLDGWNVNVNMLFMAGGDPFGSEFFFTFSYKELEKLMDHSYGCTYVVCLVIWLKEREK